MCTDVTTLPISEIREFFSSQNITADVIEVYQAKKRIVDYLIDNKYILRTSKAVMEDQFKQDRVKSITLVPKIYLSGSFTVSDDSYYFLLTDYVQGSDLYSVLPLTEEQSVSIGYEIANFLVDLHSVKDSSYDIGHYVPTIPRYKGSWKQGHLEYIQTLKNSLVGMKIQPENIDTITSAFDYMYANINCLDYQTGGRLLHNDFHPKNIIIEKGRLAGVIDWECSQFGEADFELAHLFHWCVYPPKQDGRFDLLLKTIFEELMINLRVPNIEKRLTIYQLEHELNQIVWNGSKQEQERMRRINGWLNGQVEEILSKWRTI